jgi:glycosyltransferase involved in cell wall biosynthesis
VKPKNLLIISPLISVNAPQPARFRELISRWSSHFDITVLSFNTGREDIISHMGATPALMEFSAAGRLLIGSRLKNRGNQKQGAIPGSTGHRPGFRGLLKKIHINMLFFPDIFIVEYLKIKRHLFDLVGKIQPETVIISTAPFTLMLLAGPLKRRFPEIRVVVDTGDPFRGDSSSYSRRLLHRLFAGKLERKCLTSTDLLVVPTAILKKHYLNSYEGIIAERKVQIVEIGISDIFNHIPNGRTDRNPPIRIVNAGRFYKSLRDPSELYRAVCQFPVGEVVLKVFGNIQDKYKPPASDPRFFTGGAISSEQLAHEYEQSDLVIFLDNARGVQVPGKLYELLSVNRPVLYIYRDSAAPSYDLVKGQDGVVMVQNNHRDIAAGITQIMKMEPGQKYSRGSDMYSYDSLAERYRALLEDLVVPNSMT